MKQMKRLVSALLAICMIMVMIPVTVSAAESGTCGDNVTWTLSDDGVLTISGSGPMEDYTVYWYDETCEDGEPNTPWYECSDDIQSIIIEDGVTQIGDYAFCLLRNLTNVTMSDSVTSIGRSAFYLCFRLPNITLGEGVTTIGRGAFNSCTGLNHVTLSSNVSIIDDFAFNGCDYMYSINFPDSVTTIGRYAFGACSNLDNVIIGRGVSTIGDHAFGGCNSLDELYFLGSAPSIGSEAFNGNTTTVYYPANDASWTDSVMQNYGGNITWISSIGCNHEYATVVVSPTCTDRGYTIYTCDHCGDGYTSDFVDAYGHSFEDGTCTRCGKEFTVVSNGSCGENVTWTLTNDGTLLISGEGPIADFNYYYEDEYDDGEPDTPWYAYKNDICTVIIEHGVTHIGDYAFFFLRNLTSVTIPDSITSIGRSAFEDCLSLPSITLGENVTSIGIAAFEYCTSLTTVLISDSVTTIGDFAFQDCYQLNGVRIPDSVISIGRYAFAWCDNLDDIIIGNGVASIGDYVFGGCGSLDELYFLGSAPSIGSNAFYKNATTVYYPANDASWTEEVMQDYGGEITWVSISRCNHEYTVTVVEPTCTTEGYTTYTCSICGDTYTEAIPAAGHDYTSVITAPTCTEDGFTTYTCHCGDTYVGDNVGALGHTYENGTCSVCGHVSVAAPVAKGSNDTATGKPVVTWEPVEGAVKYEVYRSTKKDGTYTRGTSTTGTTYTNTKAVAGKYYYYFVRAIDADGNYANSNIIGRTCDLAQTTITVSNVASTGKVKISWTAVEGATKYQVYRATSKNGTYSRISTTANTSVTNTKAEAGKTYYYKVRAICDVDAAAAAYSAVKSRTCDLPRPDVSIALSSKKPKVSWDKVTGAVEYKVYRATSKTGTYSLVKTTTASYYRDTKATAGKTYYYKVVAVCSNTAGNSAYSSIVSIKSK